MPISRATSEAVEAAEALALSAVQFIAADDDRLQRFMNLCGVAPESLRSRLHEPAFLAGVLDYLLGDEPLLIAFAEWMDIDPGRIGAARRSFAAGDADS